MNTPILKVTDLRAGYGKAEVLHGLSLQADKGSVITVIGPNGAGKSTLTNLLSGDLPPTSGQITLDGHNITGWTPEKISRHRLGRSYQKTNIFRTFSVWDNVRLAAQSRRRYAPWNPAQWFTRADAQAATNASCERAIELADLGGGRGLGDIVHSRVTLRFKRALSQQLRD